MRILFTGGTGFIGTELQHKLLADKHQLIMLTRKPEQFASHPAEAIAAISSLDELANNDQFDAIINLAGEAIATQRWSPKRKEILLNSRLDTTQALLDFIARTEHKPGCLINASAVGFYGDQGDAEVDESTLPNPDFGHRLCASWEALAQQAEQHGVRVCIVRIGLVVGADGGFLQRLLFPFKLGLGGPIGNGRQWMSWVHLDDLTELMLWLLRNHKTQGIYNGVAPTPVINNEFTRILANCLHRPAFLPVPATVLRLALGEMAGLLLTGQRVLPRHALDQGFQFRFSQLEDALLDII